MDLEALEHRSFAFYPPIVNVEHNEWRFRKATWSELLIVNARSDLEVWIPRRLIGEVSSVDEPVVIVGLLKELEYKAGTVWPHERRVFEMPRVAAADPAAPLAPPPHRASYAGGAESRVGRLIAIVLGVVLGACLLLFAISRLGPVRPVKYTAADQDYLSLSRRDDYFAVVEKLGRPAEDRWRPQSSELEYRALWYPQRSYYVILLGPSRNEARYIGTLDRNWRMIHYVDLPSSGNTAAILRALPRF